MPTNAVRDVGEDAVTRFLSLGTREGRILTQLATNVYSTLAYPLRSNSHVRKLLRSEFSPSSPKVDGLSYTSRRLPHGLRATSARRPSCKMTVGSGATRRRSLAFVGWGRKRQKAGQTHYILVYSTLFFTVIRSFHSMQNGTSPRFRGTLSTAAVADPLLPTVFTFSA